MTLVPSILKLQQSFLHFWNPQDQGYIPRSYIYILWAHMATHPQTYICVRGREWANSGIDGKFGHNEGGVQDGREVDRSPCSEIRSV